MKRVPINAFIAMLFLVTNQSANAAAAPDMSAEADQKGGKLLNVVTNTYAINSDSILSLSSPILLGRAHAVALQTGAIVVADSAVPSATYSIESTESSTGGYSMSSTGYPYPLLMSSAGTTESIYFTEDRPPILPLRGLAQIIISNAEIADARGSMGYGQSPTTPMARFMINSLNGYPPKMALKELIHDSISNAAAVRAGAGAAAADSAMSLSATTASGARTSGAAKEEAKAVSKAESSCSSGGSGGAPAVADPAMLAVTAPPGGPAMLDDEDAAVEDSAMSFAASAADAKAKKAQPKKVQKRKAKLKKAKRKMAQASGLHKEKH